jgi:hypothetical protein
MSLWVCRKCGKLTGGSLGAPRCAACGSLNVARAEFHPGEASESGVLRSCLVTKNTCGTDTWAGEATCPCANCQAWLMEQTP